MIGRIVGVIVGAAIALTGYGMLKPAVFAKYFDFSKLSLGPFVVSGGEPVAMTVVDALARLLPGSLADDRSSEEESFAPSLDGALEYPHYTRPADWRGIGVPEVLLSGHHARIEEWRRQQAAAREADSRGG